MAAHTALQSCSVNYRKRGHCMWIRQCTTILHWAIYCRHPRTYKTVHLQPKRWNYYSYFNPSLHTKQDSTICSHQIKLIHQGPFKCESALYCDPLWQWPKNSQAPMIALPPSFTCKIMLIIKDMNGHHSKSCSVHVCAISAKYCISCPTHLLPTQAKHSLRCRRHKLVITVHFRDIVWLFLRIRLGVWCLPGTGKLCVSHCFFLLYKAI